jgi:hypothetical protein
MIDALSLEVDCNRCCIIPYLPLLLYPWNTLVNKVELNA